jgi:peptidoglycan hydrolase-like protein with peptidoglycan-binding domain
MVGAPLVSSATTVEDLHQQVQSLFEKITQLQQQLTAKRQEHTESAGSAASPPSVISEVRPSQRCFRLNRVLLRGMSGDDVRVLQEELKTRGLFSGDATGFFGPLTEQAVQSLQRVLGIVSSGDATTTGYGIVGPLTQKGLWVCDNTTIVDGALKATPQSGTAPLTVNFETRISGFQGGADTYTIEYGDDTSDPVTFCHAPTDVCQDPGVNTHTYSADGIYMARLIRTHDECAHWTETTACTRPVSRQELGRVRVAVGTQVACPAIAYQRPICSEGEVAEPTQTDGFCPGPWRCVPKSSVDNKAPSISSLSGPTTLDVNTQGTWTITASDPENEKLSYNVRWGDEGSFAAILGLAGEQAFVQQATFTHTYTRAGLYSIVVVARDDQGHTARITVQVRVGTVGTEIPGTPTGSGTTTGSSATGTCAEEYAPVCGLKPLNCGSMNAATCLVALRDVSLVTYGNRCRLQAAGATYLRAGTCPAAGAFGIVCWAPGSESTTAAADVPFAEGEHTQRVRLEGGTISSAANYVCHNGRWGREPAQPGTPVSQETTNQLAAILAAIDALISTMQASVGQ